MKFTIPGFFSKSPLYVQILFASFAFFLMVVLSIIFTSRIVRANLLRNVESVLNSVESQIDSDLMESRIILDEFAQSIQYLILHGADADKLRAYNDYISNNLLSRNMDILGPTGPYGYIETLVGGPFFLIGIGWNLPEDYSPMDRPWYKAAIEADGDIAETEPYEDIITRETVITHARCIFDGDGNRLGVIAIQVRAGYIGEKVVNIFTKDGYGALISQDLTILGHPNPLFINMKMYNPEVPVSAFADELVRTGKITEATFTNWKGVKTIASFRTLANGWYLGVMTEKSDFYQSVTNMALILSVLGVSLAAVLVLILIRVDEEKNKSDAESKHKSMFLANMSHEIRTPMNAIIGMTTIGKSEPSVERKDYCFIKIEDASHHLLGVINDILDMSKIEANKFELSESEFDLEKMLRRVVNVINFRIDEKHQRFTVHIDNSIPGNLIGDEQRIAQVITNLLGNAVKFTPENGSISLTVSLAGMGNDICTLQVSVSDSGIGISPEQQAKLFKSFEQAESSTTRKYGGTGLGLAISKNIVELMGGSIWIESELGKGATFIFTIQLKRGTKEKRKLLSSDINSKNVRILAVDDDADVLTYFNEIAQNYNLMCDTAENGEEALKLIEQKGGYNIYFIDWKMPGMDGIQLAQKIKAHVTKNSIVTMISAAEWGDIADEAKNAGVDKFMSKPLFPSTIAEMINECLGMDKQQEKKSKLEENADIFAGRRILLAEDVEINREIILTLLEPTKIEVDCAENGKVAVRKFTKAPDKYELIFMDIQMPEMDGFEAAQRIRAVEAEYNSKITETIDTNLTENDNKIIEFPQKTNNNVSTSFTEGETRSNNRNLLRQIPIIAMTANVFKEDIEKCLASGMNGHVGKPLDIEEVMSTLHKYLD